MSQLRDMHFRNATLEELIDADARCDESARQALASYDELSRAGCRHPEIQFSDIEGWRVRDPDLRRV